MATEDGDQNPEEFWSNIESNSPDFQAKILLALLGIIGRKIFGEQNYEDLEHAYSQHKLFDRIPSLKEDQIPKFEQYCKLYDLYLNADEAGGVDYFTQKIKEDWNTEVKKEDITKARQIATLVTVEQQEP